MPMFAHLKIRTGMIGVLLLFVIALLFSTLNGWRSAVRSHEHIDELGRTSRQIDGINNALLLAIRTSAKVNASTTDLRDPQLKALAEDLKRAFAVYGTAIVGQRAATRARSAEEYFQVNIDAGNSMTKLQEIRVKLVGALEARAQES